MKISVVLATYNGEDYIERQIESILNQTILPNEIVVTDDGSKDRTLDIIRKFRNYNSNIEWLFTVNKRSGFVSNFINGIQHSSGDIIFLSDQDDKWKSEKISKHLAVYEQYKDASLIHGEIDIADLEENILKTGTQGYHHNLKKISFEEFLNKPNYPGMSISFKKELFYQYQNFIKLHEASIKTHDYLLVMFSAINGGFYAMGECLCNRTFTGENVALNLDRKDKFKRTQRIESALTNIAQYTLVLDFLNFYNKNDCQINQTELLLNKQKLRYNFLKQRNIKNTVKYFVSNLKQMSLKTFIADFISF